MAALGSDYAKGLERDRSLARRYRPEGVTDAPCEAKSALVVGNVAMTENIRLFICKSESGRYWAEFCEGLRSPMDPAHVVSVDFPPDLARVVNHFGGPTGDQSYGKLTVNVSAGGHTPYQPQYLEAKEGLSLDDFYAALTAGKVSDRK